MSDAAILAGCIARSIFQNSCSTKVGRKRGMEPGFQIYESHKAESSSPIEHMNDLATAMIIAVLFIALGVAKFGPLWLINY
ncbi:hypothetical protein ACLXNF_20540 [Mycobacteroides chelonae]|uniref:hypothetical protein n=1 Tax=Mycobacteroides chelonae TaxID=1774 RepID=UPI0039EA2489